MKNVNRTFPLFLTVLLLLCGSLTFGQDKTLRTEHDGFRWYELQQDGYRGAQSINGTTLIPLSRKYTFICYHSIDGGWFTIRKNNSSTYEGCCDLNGREIIAPEKGYDEVHYRRDKDIVYVIIKRNGLEGVCDLNGREIIAPERGYDKVYYWVDKGYALVERNGLEGVCDLNGREIIAPERGYDKVHYWVDEGYALVERKGREGACDLNGREIIAPQYKSLILSCGEFKYKKSRDKWVSTGIKYDGGTGVSSNSSSASNSEAGNMTFTVNGISFEMVAVKGGTFTMGCTSEQGSDCGDDESPAHRVTLSDYYIGETEVTQALWKAVMDSNPSGWSGDNLPVENVSWYDMQEFIQRLNQMTGRYFRLPTEAEWEYAARGGSQSRGYKYSGSSALDDVAWHGDNSGGKTHPVKTKQPNELGLYDMSGNVFELCADWYDSYSSGAQTNPAGPSSGEGRVSRGGCWGGDGGWICRVSARSDFNPNYREMHTGFRLAF